MDVRVRRSTSGPFEPVLVGEYGRPWLTELQSCRTVGPGLESLVLHHTSWCGERSHLVDGIFGIEGAKEVDRSDVAIWVAVG